MSSSDLERPGSGAPAVGNILGFSLLFRRRKALLALHKRGLAPGVRLEDYQAEIPDVEFPLRGRVSAKNFSQRRCAVVQGVLKVETRAVAPWLGETLRGRRLAGLQIDDVGLEIRSPMPGSSNGPGAARVCLTLDATAPDGRRAFVVLGFRPKPKGRALSLELSHRWVFGSSPLSIPDLLEALTFALSPYVVLTGHQNGSPATLVVDVARWALTGPFVRAGWKAPSLDRLGIESLSISRRGVVLDLRSEIEDGPLPDGGDAADPVGDALVELHDALGQPPADADPVETRQVVVEGLLRIAELIASMPAAHAACVRWIAELSRFVLPRVHLDAVRRWIALEPTAPAPRSLYVPALGRAGEHGELARVLAAEIRSASSEASRSRLELALATLLIEQLDDPRTALAIVGPLVARLRNLGVGERQALGVDAMTSALTVLAQARAADRAERSDRDQSSNKIPGHVAEAIEDALQHTRDPRRRADVQIRVGKTLARHGARGQALTLLTRALREDPDDLDTLELAIELATELGDLEAAFALLHTRLSMAPSREREGPRRELIRMALELDTAPARSAAHDELGHALSIEPDDPDLLAMAKDLALRTEDLGAAAMHLGRWVDVVDDEQLRLEGQLELARLLSRLDRRDEAWAQLREPLEGEVDVGVLELALEVAPAPRRVDLLDSLIERAAGPQRGRALVERAALSISAPGKLADLWEAAQLVQHPRDVLTQIERLLADHEVEGLERLADLAHELQERGIEARVQARLGLALLARGGLEAEAAPALDRALELDPRRHDLEEPLGLALAELGERERALEHLRQAADRAEPLSQDWERLTLHWTRLALDLGRFEAAQPGLERLLDVADARRGEGEGEQTATQRAADDAAALLFDLHVTVGQREAARELARARAKRGTPDVRAAWLARQADLSEDKRRASLLEQAHELMPRNPGYAAALEQTLTQLGELGRLERLLANRVAAGDEDLPPESRDRDALRRLVRITAQRWRAASDEDRQQLGARLAERTDELLHDAPDDVEGLMFAAELDAGRGDDDAALEKWRLAATRIPADDPAFLGPALALGNAALRRGDVVEGRRFLSRAADLDPQNAEVLESLRALGRAVDDAQLLIRVLPQLVAGAPTQSQAAALELELAQADFDERLVDDGFAALERAAALVDPMAQSQRELALRVLRTWRNEAQALDQPEQEAVARARLRRALGDELSLDEALEEVALLVRLERRDDAVAVASRRLRHEVAAEALDAAKITRLTETLEQLGEAEPKPLVTALDAALETLDGRRGELGVAAAPLVEGLARAIARKAGATFPEITLRALERVDEPTALDPEFIERYASAVASFADPLPHLAHLDSLIVTGPLRPRYIAWLTRTVEGDELATAHRLINLADRARPEMALELGARSFELLRRHDQLLAALPALSAWVAHAPGPSAELQTALDVTFEALRSSGEPRPILAFLDLWERGLSAGLIAVAAQDDPQTRVRWLLEAVLARHPDHADLHRALWARLAADPLTVGAKQRRAGRLSAARDALESIATDDGTLDADRLAILLGGLAAHLTDEDAGRLALETARLHPDPAVLTQAQDMLETRSLFEQWVTLCERHGPDDTETLERLASAAQQADDAPAAARALALAGLASQRNGDGERAQRSLAASLAIQPQNPRIQVHLARLWSQLDRPADALGVLDPLLQGEGWRSSGLSFGELALESGRLALRLGQRATAIDRLTLSLRHLDPQTQACQEAREALFTLYADGGEQELAAKLAQEVAASSSDPGQRVSWLERGATLATGHDRARLLERMVAEAGRDLEVADRLESLLRDLGDRAALAALLRRRIHGDLARDEESDASRQTRIESLIAIIESGDGTTPPGEDSRRELSSLYERLLELDEAHAEAHAGLLAVAVEQSDFERARTRLEAIDALPNAAALRSQPRVRAAARTIGLDAHAKGDGGVARTLLQRSVVHDERDREAWESLAQIATSENDAELGLQANEQLAKLGLPATRQVDVLVELAGWQRARKRFDDALTSLETAAAVDLEQPELHERAVRRWLDLLAEIDPPRPAHEAQARAALRRAVGPRITMDEALAEIELLTRLERISQAIDVCVAALTVHPDDEETPRIRERLAELCTRTAEPDRELRALRAVVEALEPGTARATLGLDLARLARTHEAARTVLLAVESIPTPDDEVLSLREWAIRSLGKVEDEVRDIEARLLEPPPDRLMVTRLLRMTENDAEACAARLLDLRERADESVKPWLAKTAFEMVRERAPEQPGVALLALKSAMEDKELLAGPWWNDLALQVIERDDPHIIVDLLQTAHRAREAQVPGFADPRTSVLERALVRFPTEAALHELVLAQHGITSPRNARHHELRPALGQLDDVVHRHALGGRARGLLIEGLARAVDPEVGDDVLREQAVRFADEPEAFGQFQQALFSRRAWGHVSDLLTVRDQGSAVDIDAWLELAQAAADDDDRATEARARTYAGKELLNRGEATGAVPQLQRAHELRPADPGVAHQLGRALQQTGDVQGAYRLLRSLVDRREVVSAGAALGKLAERCAELAVELGKQSEAADMLGVALAHSEDHDNREGIAGALFALLSELEQQGHALELALSMAASPSPHRVQWLLRAADLSPPPRRAELLEEALQLRPEDDDIAAYLISTRRGEGDVDGVIELLRSRIARLRATGGPSQLLPLHEELANLLHMQGDRDDETFEVLQAIIRLDERHTNSHLRLAELALRSDDQETAAGHWATAIAQLEDDDPRLPEPLLALLEFAAARDDWAQAAPLLEREIATPLPTPLVERLLDLAYRSGESERTIDLASIVLEREDKTRSPIELHARMGSALANLGDPRRAAQAFAEAALDASDPETTVAVAQRWLRLTLAPEFPQESAAEEESRARAALRQAMGDALPAPAIAAEAELWSDRLGDRERAIELLTDGLRRHPEDDLLRSSLEARCPEPARLLNAIDSVLEGLLEGSVEARAVTPLLELALEAAQQADEPARLLEAIDKVSARVEGELALRETAAARREWAIKSLGRSDEEIDALESALEQSPRADLVDRLFRMCDRDAEATTARLLAIAERLDAERAAALASHALLLARDHAPERLDLPATAITVMARAQDPDRLRGYWDELEELAVEAEQYEILVQLFEVACAAQAAGAFSFDTRADRVYETLLPRLPGDARIHQAFVRRYEAPEQAIPAFEQVMEELALDQPQTVEAAVGLADALGPEHARGFLLAWAGRFEREASLEPARQLLDALLETGQLDTVLDQLLPAAAHPDLASELLPRVAARAREDGAAPAWRRASLALGRLDLERASDGDEAATARAIESFEQALQASTPGDDEGDAADPAFVLLARFGLAAALDRAGRPDAALEHYLPLLGDLEESEIDPAAIRGGEGGEDLVLPAFQVARRSAELLVSVSATERASAMLDRAYGLAKLESREIRLDLLTRRYDLLELSQATDASEQRRSVAHRALDLGAQDDRVDWLLRLARNAEGDERLEALRQASERAGDDPRVLDAYEGELSARAEPDRLAELERLARGRFRIALSEGSDDAKARALRVLEVVDLRARVEGGDDEAYGQQRVDLYNAILRIDPEDADARLGLGNALEKRGDHAGAMEQWVRAGELMPHDDDRFFAPARSIARHVANQGRPHTAVGFLRRALDIRPGDQESQRELLSVAADLGDGELVLECAQALLEHGDPDIADLEASCGWALRRLGRPQEAHQAYTRAAQAVEPGSEDHFEIARAWLNLVQDDLRSVDATIRAEAEAAARSHLRLALGSSLPSSELRMEAHVLSEELGRTTEALELVEMELGRRTSDELLLSTFKDLCYRAEQLQRYARVLESILERVSNDEVRDRLAIELAYTAVDIDEPAKVLETLERVSPAKIGDPELLDLREWSVRALGRVEDELGEIESGLLTRARRTPGGQTDAVLLSRLVRMLDNNLDAAARRLLELASRSDPPVLPLAESVLEMIGESAGVSLSTALEAAAATLRCGTAKPLQLHYASLEALALAATDADGVADLLTLGMRALSESGVSGDGPLPDVGDLERRVDTLAAEGLRRFPAGESLHRYFWKYAPRDENDTPAKAASRHLSRLVDRLGLRGEQAARAFGGLAELLERPEAAELLGEQAQQALNHGEELTFSALVTVLEQKNHWPEVMRLLELRAESATDEDGSVAALKHLAHIRAEVLGDADTAIKQLERALTLAPRDPDLLLPLLDHHYAQRDLGRAIELSERVLEHVPMGEFAFVALGHRAADAALAHGDQQQAESLLRRVLARVPGEDRTSARLSELAERANDPNHRVAMLGAIAQRQTGSARSEALEERARLLVEQLERYDEAIADLETVMEEGSPREGTVELLESLYSRQEHWPELVYLLERDYPRRTGLQRSQTLFRIGQTYHTRLFDLPKAEQAFRLALETLGVGPEERALADQIHLQLVAVLEEQGRYSELADHLERELAGELEATLDLDTDTDTKIDVAPARVDLLGHLARVHRTYLEDEGRAAFVYEQLEYLGQLPDDGLATLARWYRAQHRHEDLVRILNIRAKALASAGDVERKAELDRRIAELLEGPLRRPHEAARHYLDAYLANPEENHAAGSRARVLLAGTDSVRNVRKLLLERIEHLTPAYRPYGLSLLGDLLAPQESFEEQAEQCYRLALEHERDLGSAREGLGRLLARQGRLEEAVDPLVGAAHSPTLTPERAADAAATAARVLLELDRASEAENVLRHALGRAPDAERALLELARLYNRLGQAEEEAAVLDDLSELSLSSLLRAEVAFRRAMLLERDFRADPLSEAGEQARGFLLEAVGADAMHAQARQVLLELATSRSEWSIVAHMHFLAIRELQPGTQRALTHLDLAEVYLDRLHDSESATRNLTAALAQPADELIIEKRGAALADRLPTPRAVADRLETTAQNDREATEAARARLLMFASQLRVKLGEFDDASALLRRVLEAQGVPDRVKASAKRRLDSLSGGDFELHQQREALISLLEEEEHDAERLHILSRLRDVGRALDDAELVQRCGRDLLELAHRMIREGNDDEAASAALRDLFAERGDYRSIVKLYEDLAARSGDPNDAAQFLTDAAGFAWAGVRDPELSIAILRRAIALVPEREETLVVLADIAAQIDDRALDESLCAELGELDAQRRAPKTTLVLAQAAHRLSRDLEAEGLLRDLVRKPGGGEGRRVPPDVELAALSTLEDIYARAGQARERLPLLARRAILLQTADRDAARGAQLELVRAQRDAGDLNAALDACEVALDNDPRDVELTHLYAELLEDAEDWARLGSTLARLADIHTDPASQAHWLTRAARVRLDHAEDGALAMSRARKLLQRACDVAPQAPEPRSVLLPVAFAQRRFEEVLDLTIQLRALVGDDDEALLFGALVEALVHGRRTVARNIGTRHSREVRSQILWPALTQVLEVVAQEGPLGRLDAVLGAASSLANGSEAFFGEFSSWAAGSPPRAGLCLGLARLHEAFGQADPSRYLYQLAAFMAPHGPVVALVSRLPDAALPDNPLQDLDWVPLSWRGVLREVLIQLRGFLAGVRGPTGSTRMPQNAIERATVQSAGRVVARWRDPLGITVPIRFTSDRMHAGIGLHNELEPLVVVNESFITLSDSEQAVRLALSAGAIASGLAIVADVDPLGLDDLLDALRKLTLADHVPESRPARHIADALAARGLRAGQLGADLRNTLSRELEHWLDGPGNVELLIVIIRRALLALATRLSGRLDGALFTLARDQNLLDATDVPDVDAVLDSEDARWLLRTLNVLPS